MTTAANQPSEPLEPRSIRIGDADRSTADEELRQHLAAGRISLDEYDQRAQRVFNARTQADLDAVFTDLPGPHGPSSGPVARSSSQYPAYAAPPAASAVASGDARSPMAAGLMAGVPIAATILFFLCGFVFDGWSWSWIFFLLVPLAGAVLGPSLNANRKDRRRLG